METPLKISLRAFLPQVFFSLHRLGKRWLLEVLLKAGVTFWDLGLRLSIHRGFILSGLG